MNIQLAALVILISSSLILVLMIAFNSRLKYCHWLTGLALVAAFSAQSLVLNAPSQAIALLTFTPLSLSLSQLALIIVFIIYWPLQPWLRKHSERPRQFYLLLHWSTIGALIIIFANHFAMFFVGLELLTLSLISLIAYLCPNQKAPTLAIEAAIKYLILSAVASAVILLGFALLYINTGNLFFDALAMDSAITPLPSWLHTAAVVFILGGMLFKLSLAPCHLWFADVLQGAPAPTAALLSTLSKLAVFTVLFKLFLFNDWYKTAAIEQIITGVAIISMLLGNILALKQQNIYRLLAYSSISHFGYLLIIICLSSSSTIVGSEILLFYLFAYLIALSALFSILSQLGQSNTLAQLRGLLWRQPLVAVSLMLMILSLAGIPLTLGFVGKFYLLLSGVEEQVWGLIGALIAGSIISMFYYFNLLISLSKPNDEACPSNESTIPFSSTLVNNMAAVTIIAFGLNPEPISQLIFQWTR